MIYLIVFGDISASLGKSAYGPGTDNILTNRLTYMISIALIMLPICLKKMLREMACVSILLFSAIAIFIVIFVI